MLKMELNDVYVCYAYPSLEVQDNILIRASIISH